MHNVVLRPFTPSRRKKITSFLARVSGPLLVLAILFLIFIAYGWIINNRWYRLLVVHSGSMSPTFNAGDMILITRPPEELEPGMIVTFQIRGEIITHRITEIAEGGCIRTKGDANEDEDRWTDEEGQEMQITQVAGIYRGRIPYLGYILSFPRTILSTGAWLSDVERSSGNLVQAGTWDPPIPNPAAPTGLEASYFQSDRGEKDSEVVEPTPTEEPACLNLDWDDNTEEDLAGYKVYRSLESGGPYDFIAETETSSYEDCGLESGTYFYVVTAFEHAGHESGYSNEASGTVPEPIVEPTPEVTPTTEPTPAPEPTETE